MTNKNKYLKTIGSSLIVGAFLFFALGSGKSKGDLEERNIENLIIEGNSASFTFNVGFMYTSEHVRLSRDVWTI